MYKKLMFLISLVALLSLVHIVSAAEWNGDGATASFDDPDNWVADAVPGAGEECTVRNPGAIGRGPIIDSVEVVKEIKDGPDGNMAIDWVSGGHLTVDHWYETWGEDPDGGGIATFNWLGGTLVNLGDSGDDEVFRVCNHGENVFNIEGTFVLDCRGNFKVGDNDDATVDWNQSGGTVDITDIGDGADFEWGSDGGGTMDITGGSLNIAGDFRLAGRDEDQTLNLGGTGSIYVGGSMHISEEGEGSEVIVNMTGGTIDADKVTFFDDDTDDDPHVELHMSGGLIIARNKFQTGDNDGTGAIELTGGVVQCGDFELDQDDIVVDVNGGMIIIDGDKVTQINDYVADDKITACGGQQRGLEVDYGVTNPGKTTVSNACTWDRCIAWLPSPGSGASAIEVGVVLSWESSEYLDPMNVMHRHILYFGDDYDAVEAATASSPERVAGSLDPDEEEFDCATFDDLDPLDDPLYPDHDLLELWTTYHWRIDEIYGPPGPPCPLGGKGDVWTFTTGCELIDGDLTLPLPDCLVNFTDYAQEANAQGDEAFFP